MKTIPVEKSARQRPIVARYFSLTLLLMLVSLVAANRLLGQSESPPGAETFEADLSRLDTIWDSPESLQRLEDAYRVTVRLGKIEFKVATHLFEQPINIIPYSDQDPSLDASGKRFERGDEVLARYLGRGQIGFAVRHHCPSHRLFAESEGAELADFIKFQDTHAMALIGVDRGGLPGVITINNPQGYQGGRFGDGADLGYTAIFFRPRFPDYLAPAQAAAFEANIRTMLVGFNAVADFPYSDYDGGDPLGARNPLNVITHTVMMVKAITGDAQAKAFFQKPATKIYCAELLHLSTSAGLILPLNDRAMMPLVGRDTWESFKSFVKEHNEGRSTAFTTMNTNPMIRYVDLSLAPEDLTACWKYAPAHLAREEFEKLAFQPMSMADMVEQFLQTYVPREALGESIAPAQAAILRHVKPGLIEALALSGRDPTQARQAAEEIFDQLVVLIDRSYSDYQEFREAIRPLLEKARNFAGPRGTSGSGLFVPPHLFHLLAQGKMTGGLLRLEYLGHGLPFSTVRSRISDR